MAEQVPGATEVRRWLHELGQVIVGSTPPPAPVVHTDTPPPGFPSSIQVDTITFADWSGYVTVEGVQVARATSPDDVVAVCNWAAGSGWKVRAVGAAHNWSPLLLDHGAAPSPKVMLVDTTALTSCRSSEINGTVVATFGTGITIDAATAWLATLDNGGASAAPGYALPQTTAPGHLTLGGILAIGGHGTLVPAATGGAWPSGCLSNLVVSFDAVVTDPNGPTPHAYSLKTFDRTEVDSAAFLVHLGRAFLTSVTLQVVPNYFLQLTPLFPTCLQLFPPTESNPPAPLSFASLLDEYGRVEVLWFPYTTATFVQCNQVQTTELPPQVTGPYNYPWMNDISEWDNKVIAAALWDSPSRTQWFTAGEAAMAASHLEGTTLNGTARDLEIYLRDTTLRVSLFGWGLQVPRAQVQGVATQFYAQVKSMLDAGEAAGRYPINAAMEIRCNTLDHQDALPQPGCPPPALAASRPVNPDDPAIDTLIWLNLGTITDTPGANQFYTDLETWMLETWGTQNPSYLRPEWSKAFAYTPAGPWTNDATLALIREAYDQPGAAPYTFSWAAATLAGYDAANLFTSPLLAKLFGN